MFPHYRAAAISASGGGGSFSPSDLLPALWLDAADSSTLFDATSGGSTPANGGFVRRWQDKSGNLRHVTEAIVAPTRQTSVQNSKDVVRFSGSNKLAHSSSSVWNFLHNGTIHWIFVVAKYGTSSNPNAAYTLFDTCGLASSNIGATYMYEDRTGPEPIPNVANNALRHFVGRGVNQTFVINAINADSLNPNTFLLHSTKIDPSNAIAADRSISRVNEVDVTKTNSATDAVSTGNSTFPLTIGQTGGGITSLTGDIGEIIIVPTDITVTQRNNCEAYLRNKWGTQTPE